MKKRNIIITAVTILTITLVLSLAACSPKQSELEETEIPTETAAVTEATEATGPVIEPTEVATEAATEPVETAPEATQPVTTSKPSTGTGTDNSNGNGVNSSGTTTVAPTATEPVSVETPNVAPTPNPAPAEPEVTEPEPTEHAHSWQEVYHEEISHEVEMVVCGCGSSFGSLDAWISHNKNASSADIITCSHYAYVYDTIIDTPAYSTWFCACGATSDTQP